MSQRELVENLIHLIIGDLDYIKRDTETNDEIINMPSDVPIYFTKQRRLWHNSNLYDLDLRYYKNDLPESKEDIILRIKDGKILSSSKHSLTEKQIKYAKELLISVNKFERTVEYNELAKRVDPTINPRNVGHDIGAISFLCNELGLPLLSAKVVSAGTKKSGKGFFNLMSMCGRNIEGRNEDELFNQELNAIMECTEWYILARHLGLNINFPNISNPTIAEEVTEETTEGAKTKITVNAYERNAAARRICIATHGTDCKICGISFEKLYGSIGAGFIHVHHIVPIHSIGEKYTVNGKNDLIPVCPNCHAMLHKKIDASYLSIDELKAIVKENS